MRARARAYSPFLWRFNRSSASCLKLARNAIKSACVLIRVPDCVSHVITLHPRTTRRTTYARSRSLFAKGLFPATIAPLFNHRARARARASCANKNGVPRFVARDPRTKRSSRRARGDKNRGDFTRRPEKGRIHKDARGKNGASNYEL